MRVLRLAYLQKILPNSAQTNTILGLLLWSGVTAFIFGIIINFFH